MKAWFSAIGFECLHPQLGELGLDGVALLTGRIDYIVIMLKVDSSISAVEVIEKLSLLRLHADEFNKGIPANWRLIHHLGGRRVARCVHCGDVLSSRHWRSGKHSLMRRMNMVLYSLWLQAETSRGVFVKPMNLSMRLIVCPQSGRVHRERDRER